MLHPPQTSSNAKHISCVNCHIQIAILKSKHRIKYPMWSSRKSTLLCVEQSGTEEIGLPALGVSSDASVFAHPFLLLSDLIMLYTTNKNPSILASATAEHLSPSRNGGGGTIPLSL